MSASTSRVSLYIGRQRSINETDKSGLVVSRSQLLREIEKAIRTLNNGEKQEVVFRHDAWVSSDDRKSGWYKHTDIVDAINLYFEQYYDRKFICLKVGARSASQEFTIRLRDCSLGGERKQASITNRAVQERTAESLLDSYLEREGIPVEEAPRLKEAIALLVTGVKAKRDSAGQLPRTDKPILGRHTARVERLDVPPLPDQAPLRWKHREKDETPPEFIRRIYGPWLGEDVPSSRRLPRSRLSVLDNALYKALRDFERGGVALPEDFGFAPRGKTTPEELDAFRRGDRPSNYRDYNRLSKALKKENKVESER